MKEKVFVGGKTFCNGISEGKGLDNGDEDLLKWKMRGKRS